MNRNCQRTPLMLTGALLTFGCVAGIAANAPTAVPIAMGTNQIYGPWHSATIGGGGYVQNVVLAPSDPKRVYAYGDMCGAFRSDDGGASWRMIHGTLPTSAGNYEFSGLLVDPKNANRILVATGGQWSQEGIYASNDGGTTWTKTLTAYWVGNGPHRANGFLLNRDPKNPNVILAASLGTGVFRSEDNGATWKNCGATGLYSSDIRFDRTNSNRAYLCAIGDAKLKLGTYQSLDGGFYRSEDGGKTWAKLSDASPSEIAQDPTASGTLYGIFGGTTIQRSLDGGATWQPFADGLPTTGDCHFNALGVGPNFVLTATNGKGIFYRLDAGQSTWKQIERTNWDRSEFHLAYGVPGQATGSITVDPRNPNHWYATDFMGIYQTWDAGKTSKLTPKGLELTVVHTIAPDFADPKLVQVGLADVGGYWSDDAGSSYHSISIPQGGSNIKMISQSPTMTNIVYEVGSAGYGDWTSNQVFVSEDRGKHYGRVPMTGTGLPKGWLTCDSIVADPKNAQTVYLTNAHPIGPDDGGVYKSADGGKSWVWMGQGLPDKKWYFQSNLWVHGPEIAVSSDGSLLAISNQSHFANRYDPADKTWKGAKIGDHGTLYSVVADALKPGRFFVGVVGDGVYRSDDSGATWKRVFDQSVQYVATDPRVAGRVAAGTKDGVALSTDGGTTWTMLDKSLPYRLYNRVGFAGNRLLAGTAGSGMFWYDLGDKPTNTIAANVH